MVSAKVERSEDEDVDMAQADESDQGDVKPSTEGADNTFLHPASAADADASFSKRESQDRAPSHAPKTTGKWPAGPDASGGEAQAGDAEAATDQVSRKRSVSAVDGGEENVSAAKRVAFSWASYRELYNEEIEDAASGRRWDRGDSRSWTGSQLGTSSWAAEQKEALFDAVARCGRDALPLIAEAVGKSVPEVQQYLLLLEDGLIECKAKDSSSDLMQPHEYPAAVELGEDLVQLLDDKADKLEVRQRVWEEQREKEIWGDYWLLDADLATRVQYRYDQEAKEKEPANPANSETEDEPREESPGGSEDESSEDSDDEADAKIENEKDGDVLDHIPTARLLHLPHMLKLSQNVFMNSNHKHSNWSHYSASSPSIRHAAFADFHALALTLTRRILSVVLFQARTRFRTGGEANRIDERRRVVYAADVLTALDVLGLKHNSADAWLNAPRRLGLRCEVAASNRNIFEMHLPVGLVSLAEAETALRNLGTGRLRSRSRGSGRSERAASRDDVDMSGTDRSNELEEVADAGTTSDNEQSTEDDDDDDDEAESESETEEEELALGKEEEDDDDEAESETEEEELALEKEEDDALERYDAAARAEEESRLWAIGGKDRGLGTQEDGKSGMPKLSTARPENVRDWRDWTEYRAPWEDRVTGHSSA